MGFFSAEMASMLDIYQSENIDLMSIYDRLILAGEKKNSFTKDEINEIFRTAHSIKGSSAIMGLTVLAELTHKMEDLFGIFRDDPNRIEGHVTDILDLFFSYSDYVKGEIQRVSDPEYAQREVPSLVQELDQAIQHFGGKDKQKTEAAASKPTAETENVLVNGKQTILTLRFAADCAMPNVRAVVILKQLNRKWKVWHYEPEVLQGAESENAIKTNGFKIQVSTADVEPIKKVLAKNTNVAKVEAEGIKTTGVEAAPQAPAKQETAKTAPVVEEAAKTTDKPKTSGENKFVNLRWSDVHNLQNITGEFVSEYSFLQNTLKHLPYSRELNTFAGTYRKLLDELMYHVSSMAMLRFSSMTPQMYRAVRDISKKENKNIEFEIRGENIEIDRNLYDAISNPLMHIIRNSLDHGIETPAERIKAGKPAKGKITLTLENQGGYVLFRITDDGKGMNPHELLAVAATKGILKKPAEQYTKQEALNLIMEPGFSTAKKITSISGRGVGMDVVNTIAVAAGGRVIIDSTPGQGTAIALYMPVSITAVDSLGFDVGPWRFYLPMYCLDKIFSAAEVATHLSHTDDGKIFFAYNDHKFGVCDMRERLKVPKKQEGFYLVGHSMESYFCIVVDAMQEQTTAVSKNLPACFNEQWTDSTGVVNGVISNDGSIGYFLSSGFLANWCNSREEHVL